MKYLKRILIQVNTLIFSDGTYFKHYQHHNNIINIITPLSTL